MNNYIIPYGERSTCIGENYFMGGRTVMCVDNVGIVVEHDNGVTPTDVDVRRHLIGWNPRRRIFIQAESLNKALEEFYGYPECRTGMKHKAWELTDSEINPIIEYAGCEHMRIMKNGNTACACYGEPTKNGWEICVLDGRDEPPLACPIQAQKNGDGWRPEVMRVGGIWVKRYTKFVVPVDSQINSIKPRVAKQS